MSNVVDVSRFNRRRIHRIVVAVTAVLALVVIGGPVTGSATAWAEDAASGPETATGVVYDDRNENGERDRGERGVRDVSVSNGREVVRTDDDGRYELPVTDETIIFVTKPAGYMVPVDDQNLPQFYYIHYPDGSPLETRYPGIEPTGPLPESVDFPLYRVREPSSYEALMFADTQATSLSEQADMVTDVIDELRGTDALFGITVGDVVNDPLNLFEPHNQNIKEIGVPWWNLPGNHDLNLDVPDDTYATDTYKSIYGPTDYSFDYGQVHYVNMDNVHYLGEGNGYIGRFDERRLEWLANDLRFVPKDKLVVLSAHIPLRTGAIRSAGVNTANVDELFEVLEGRDHLFSVAGHDTSNSWQLYLEPGEEAPLPNGANPAIWNGKNTFHHQVLAEVRGNGWRSGPEDERGVPAADMADGNPNGYYYLDVAGHNYTMRYKPASLPEDFQMRLTFRGGEGNQILGNGDRVWIPSGPSGSEGIDPAPRFAAGDWAEEQPPLLEANVFDGGEKHKVEVRFDRGDFVPMNYNPPLFGLTDGVANGNLDTYLLGMRARLTTQRPANPEPSSHIWTAPVPADLEPGEHVAVIRSTDPFGRTTETSQPFEVIG